MYARAMRAPTLVTVWAVALALAWWANRTPSPRPSDAPSSTFSAARARVDLDWIAAAPHPAGSAEHARVREHLLARLAAMGLATEVQHVPDVVAHRREGDFTVALDNVIARVDGCD